MNRSMPILRLELESMSQTICSMFSEHTAQMDLGVKAAVEEFCKPENLSAMLNKQVDEVLRVAIKSEIQNYYTYGDGRAAIKEAVKRRLDSETFHLD